jgi:hypothetical protein
MKKKVLVELFTTFILFGLVYWVAKHLIFDLPLKSILSEAVFVSLFTTIILIFALNWCVPLIQKLIKKEKKSN